MRKLLYLALLCLWLPLTAQAEDQQDAVETPDPEYYELKPSLVTNLPSGAKYIRCDVQLMVLGEENKALLAQYAPAIRHEMLLLLVEQDGNALKTPQGKEKLRQQAIASLRALLEQHTGQPLIEDLFFTNYYVR
jgi:flagellar FliL protein